MRIKFVQDWKGHRAGQVVKMTASAARELISRGIAMISKDMNKKDYKKK